MELGKVNAGKMSFGFSIVNAGQRRTEEEPQLVVVSTLGSFRITRSVSKALGIANGEYAMFINNVATVDNAIAERVPEYVNFCEANGFDVDSDEAATAFHKEFDLWALAKGIQEFTSTGRSKTMKERLSKKDRLAIVEQNFDAMLESVRNSDNEEAVAAVNREGITEEELKEILADYVEGRELPKFSGSKTANAAGKNGSDVSLNFTDANVWSALKADLPAEEAKKVNRVFAIDLEAAQTITLHNGYEEVPVKILPLGKYEDVAPSRVGTKAESAE